MRKPRPQSSHQASLPRDRRSARALDLRAFLPAAITLLAHKISASASAAYRPRFGVGVTGWRIMALLAAEPWIAPVRIAESTGLDKAAVSRALRELCRIGLVEVSAPPPRRRGVLALTTRGLALHDELVEAAQARQSRLLHGFTSVERAKLREFVDRMLNTVGEM